MLFFLNLLKRADPSRGGNSHFNHCDGYHLAYEEEQSDREIYALKSFLLPLDNI